LPLFIRTSKQAPAPLGQLTESQGPD